MSNRGRRCGRCGRDLAGTACYRVMVSELTATRDAVIDHGQTVLCPACYPAETLEGRAADGERLYDLTTRRADPEEAKEEED